jgi:hypothetical protein
MSLETDLFTLLKIVCPRVYPDIAPNSTTLPYITWNQLGGISIKPLNKTVPDKRQAVIQVNVWSKTRAEANSLMLQVDSALRQATVFSAQAESEMQTVVDPDTEYRGAMQDFRITAVR